jgi:hypothetical protein
VLCYVLPFLLAGEMLRCLKLYASGLHQRDELMATAFKGIGGLPHAKLEKLQAAEAKKVRGERQYRQGLQQLVRGWGWGNSFDQCCLAVDDPAAAAHHSPSAG